MSQAVAAVRALLAANTALTAVVPAARIMAGVLPQGTALPAIGITLVGSTTEQAVAATAKVLRTSRVQVTPMAGSYPVMRQALALARSALPRSRGTVGSVKVDAILPGAEGPDFATEEDIHQGSQDFIVKTIETAP